MGDKRTRRKRILGLDKTATHKENRTAYSKKHGHCKSRKYGTNLCEPQVDPDKRLYTFEDEYKTSRRTRGRRGLNPNAEKREKENINIALFKRLATHCGRFPIGELMEKAIRRS